jgi:hypothetical protein
MRNDDNIYREGGDKAIKNMQQTSQNNQTAIDKTEKVWYNTDMKNNNNTNGNNEMKSTITYREWLIARNESMTQEDKKEAARACLLKEKEIMAARKAAKNFEIS